MGHSIQWLKQKAKSYVEGDSSTRGSKKRPPPPLPKRKPPVPSPQKDVIAFAKRENLSQEQTRALLNMSPEKQRSLMAMSQETTQDLTTEDLRRVMNPNKRAKGGMIKPKKKKMMSGGMASKRNGNMDYRKGGMVYSTKVKKG